MLPNRLGIYLHDTPGKQAFARNQRTLSHGCIRLDLPRPVPVYVVYFTLAPAAGGLERRTDIYGRDAPLMAGLKRGSA